MTDAQTAFDNCALENCPIELTAPRLREVMSYAPLRKVALAVKGVGSQGDGTVQVLCRTPEEQKQALHILNIGNSGYGCLHVVCSARHHIIFYFV
jgi:hypothetical protein